jgi:hypothetical protein
MWRTINILVASGVTPGSILGSGLSKSNMFGTKDNKSATSAISVYVRAGRLEKRVTVAYTRTPPPTRTTVKTLIEPICKGRKIGEMGRFAYANALITRFTPSVVAMVSTPTMKSRSSPPALFSMGTVSCIFLLLKTIKSGNETACLFHLSEVYLRKDDEYKSYSS